MNSDHAADRAGPGADLRYADLWCADLRGANLRYADLRYADLRYANLGDADLRYADLRGAHLKGAHLEYAYLEGANLRGAHLEYAYLRGVNLPGGRTLDVAPHAGGVVCAECGRDIDHPYARGVHPWCRSEEDGQ